MFTRRKSQTFAIIATIAFGLVTAIQAQKGGGAKLKEPKPIPSDAHAVLWQEPTDISSRDLFLGSGGESMKPDLSNVVFVRDESRSFSKKYRVKDGAGNEWVVKIGPEAQPETAATRLVWAAGYYVDVTYLVPHVHIEGKGDFDNVRFEARTHDIKRLDQRWDWEKNPFVGTKELAGLKVLMALMNNWDIQNHNNNVLLVSDQATGEKIAEYMDTDLGASFAKEGKFTGHTRGRADQYIADRKFVAGVKNGIVEFDYRGKNQHLLKGITVEQAKWIGGILAQLSDQQIRDAFRAANYTPEEIDALAATVRARVNELANLPG
ncbi:MAG TPA: hypothetical protein VE863_01830 [Pyrinomonadaceae bacterium]|jgi:hypothetical protein|nr:hypothetical protein [Pyrinomonadaceae bacterium]